MNGPIDSLGAMSTWRRGNERGGVGEDFIPGQFKCSNDREGFVSGQGVRVCIFRSRLLRRNWSCNTHQSRETCLSPLYEVLSVSRYCLIRP